MSVLEQLLFAIVGVTMLAASLALSDPHLRSRETHDETVKNPGQGVS